MLVPALGTSKLSESFMKRLIQALIFVSFSEPAFAEFTGIDNDLGRALNILSTNWISMAKEAIPSAPLTNFQTITNRLRQESEHGNKAAQGLWGYFVVVQSQSPEDAANGLRLLRSSATNGFVPAMLNLGSLFRRGEYVQRNDSEALHWFREAADKNDPEGWTQLGACYHRGSGTPKDFTKAIECYKQAAALTNYEAMKSLGYLLMNGLGAEKDIGTAKMWFERSAKEGNNRRAMYDLGVVLSQTGSDNASIREAFEWNEHSAALGDPLAAFKMYDFYSNGRGGIETNMEVAHFWLLKAAALGSTQAEYQLGDAYERGDGVPKDIEIALGWYRKAAAKNHAPALYDLGHYYYADKTNRLSRLQSEAYMLQAAQMGHRDAQFQCAMSCFRGDAGALDCEEARNWLEIAGKNGWARAEFVLFRLYYNGVPASSMCSAYPKNVPKAIQWLRRAAEHGSFEAKNLLAILLIKGTDVEADKAEAEKLLRYSAERGHASSENDLGFTIFTGNTKKKDLVEAAMWCRLAQSQKSDTNVLRRAEVNLSKILAELTPKQKLEVDDRVNGFQTLPAPQPDPMIENWDLNPKYNAEGASEVR
jgi:TPR repeat protein